MDSLADEFTNCRYNIKGYLPVSESFGFQAALRQATGGKAFPQMVRPGTLFLNQSLTLSPTIGL